MNLFYKTNSNGIDFSRCTFELEPVDKLVVSFPYERINGTIVETVLHDIYDVNNGGKQSLCIKRNKAMMLDKQWTLQFSNDEKSMVKLKYDELIAKL